MDDPAGSASAGDGRADLLIEGAYVVTLDPRRPVVVDGSVAVVGETVAAAGPAHEVRGRPSRGRPSASTLRGAWSCPD